MQRQKIGVIMLLRRAVVRGFATYKNTTGLVGLKADPLGRETLLGLSNTVLTTIQKIPDNSQYRIDVEKWFKFIQKTTTEIEDIKKIEDELAIGQIEEVIEMAKSELELIDYYYENKGWQVVEQAQLVGDALVEEMADSIFFSNPRKVPEPATATEKK